MWIILFYPSEMAVYFNDMSWVNENKQKDVLWIILNKLLVLQTCFI